MPPLFRIRYPMEAFDGGLNSKYDPSIVADDESPDCLNVVFDDLGAVQTRDGSIKLNTTSVGSFAGDGLFTCRYNNETKTMVGWWNGTGYALNVTTFVTIPSAQSIWTAGTRVDMAMYQNLAFFGNGNTPYKYNGTEFTRHGVAQPNSGPTVTSAGAGNVPAGDVNYKVSYVNSYVVEGDVSAQTTTLTVAASCVATLTSLPLAPTSFGVNARKIYRRDVNTGGIFKLVTTISDNTSTTYVDNIASTALGAAAPTDNGLPPNWKYIIAHAERLWVVDPTNPSYLYYSDLGEPFTFGATNFLKIGDGDGENIRGLGIQGNAVIAYKDSSAHAVYMQDSDPANWVVIKTNSKYGAASHYAITDFGQGLQMFIGKRYDVLAGFFAMAGLSILPDKQQLTVAVIQSDSKSDGIEPDVFAFNSSNITKACAIQFKNKLWFSVPYGSSTSNNRVYQFDYNRRNKSDAGGSWCPFTGITAAAFTIHNGKLYYQDSQATGRVYQLDAGVYSDDGSAINSYYTTKEFYGEEGHQDNHKDFRYGIFLLETLGDWNMGLSYKIDSDRGSGTQLLINLNPGGSLWGSMRWGIDQWGGGVLRREEKVYFATSVGRRIQFKFDNRNTAGRAFKVLRGSFFYNLRGQR